MSDDVLRTLEREGDQRSRAWRLRLGLHVEPEVGDLVEIGPSRNYYDGGVLSPTFFGQPCPVRAVIVGLRPWKLTKGYSFLVRMAPPLRPSIQVAAFDRVHTVAIP